MSGTYHILLAKKGYTVDWHEESGLFVVASENPRPEFPDIMSHHSTYGEAVAWLDGFLYWVREDKP